MEKWAVALKVRGIGAGQVSDLKELCMYYTCMYIVLESFYIYIYTQRYSWYASMSPCLWQAWCKEIRSQFEKMPMKLMSFPWGSK